MPGKNDNKSFRLKKEDVGGKSGIWFLSFMNKTQYEKSIGFTKAMHFFKIF